MKMNGDCISVRKLFLNVITIITLHYLDLLGYYHIENLRNVVDTYWPSTMLLTGHLSNVAEGKFVRTYLSNKSQATCRRLMLKTMPEGSFLFHTYHIYGVYANKVSFTRKYVTSKQYTTTPGLETDKFESKDKQNGKKRFLFEIST